MTKVDFSQRMASPNKDIPAELYPEATSPLEAVSRFNTFGAARALQRRDN